MRHFQLIAGNVDVLPLLHQITLAPELWNANTVRTYHPLSVHRTIDDIVLRYQAFDRDKEDILDKVCSEIQCVNYPAFAQLPAAQGIIFPLMARVNGEHLGRVFISRMAPGVCIPPHTDRIPPAEEAFPDRPRPAEYFERYQVPLKVAPGVVFKAGDEQVFMEPGTVWWFNNLVEHSVDNFSQDDRISLVIDIRPFRP